MDSYSLFRIYGVESQIILFCYFLQTFCWQDEMIYYDMIGSLLMARQTAAGSIGLNTFWYKTLFSVYKNWARLIHFNIAPMAI